jgi:hypothetical protein
MSTAKCWRCGNDIYDHSVWCVFYKIGKREEETMTEKTEGLTPGEALDAMLAGKYTQDVNGVFFPCTIRDGLYVFAVDATHENKQSVWLSAEALSGLIFRIVPDPSIAAKKDWEKDMEAMLQHSGIGTHYAEQFMDGMRAFKAEILEELRNETK